jgi:DNA-binding transcriptional MerR regulator
MSGELSIGELADRSGLTRRAVRFYVQQRLLPVPLGKGRGRHYDASHLERLKQIAELQQAGHSLDAIRRILDGQPVSPPETPRPAPRRAPAFAAELWTRIRLMDGVEVSFDTSKHQPSVEALLRLREAVQDAFDNGESNGRSV